jgi:hypothetical protein
MTDEERLEFERLKVRVAELEARQSDVQSIEAAIKDSAMEKVARLELAWQLPGWDDEKEVARVMRIWSYAVGLICLAALVVFAVHESTGWLH